MAEKEIQQTDAEFWGALAYEMQDHEEPTIEVIGAVDTDHVFHDAPVELDDPLDVGTIPPWGESFTW